MIHRSLCFVSSLIIVTVFLQSCVRSPKAREAAYLKKGEALVASKQYSRAILEFRNAMQVMPKDAEPYYQLGIAYMGAGDVFNAFRAFYGATELNPKHLQAQKKLAELLSLTEKNDFLQDAATRLRQVLAASPDDEEATDALALTEFRMGNSEDATRRLEQSLQKFPSRLKSSVVLAQLMLVEKDLHGAEEALKRAAATAPESSTAQLALGQLYILLRQPEKAEPEIRKAIQLDPKNGPALLSLGQLQVDAKRMDEAERTFKQLSALPDRTYRDLHAIFLYQTGQNDGAISELEAQMRQDADNRVRRSRLLALYLLTNRTQDAQKLVAAALKRNPKDMDALLQRSELYLNTRNPSQAEQDVKEVLQLHPDSARAHLALARVYAIEGLRNSNVQELHEALRLDHGMLPARLALAKSFVLANHPQAALNVLDETPESQKSAVAVIVWRNWALLQAGNRQELRSGLNRTLPVTRTAELVLQDGLLRMEEKDYDGSRADAKEVLRLKPEDSRGARLLADTYLARNEAPKATQQLVDAAASRPKSASMQYLVGQWYMRNGQIIDARKAFDATLASDPNFVSAAMNLAEIDRQEHRIDAARHRLQTLLAEHPGNVDALLLLASIDEASGDRAGETADYRSALGVDSSNVYALNNLACVLAMDNPDEALQLAGRAVGIAPDNAAVQDTLGWIYYRKGMYDSAVDHLKIAVDRDPSPRREFHLAMSYVKSGHPESGKELLQKALKQDPNLATTEQGW
jgi:tetratricopeptide (TPR) repeat protein